MNPVYISIGQLIQSLRLAYVAACKALGLCNKLKRAKGQRGRIMSHLNRIRAELKRYEAQIDHAFDMLAYKGCILSKLAYGV